MGDVKKICYYVNGNSKSRNPVNTGMRLTQVPAK